MTERLRRVSPRLIARGDQVLNDVTTFRVIFKCHRSLKKRLNAFKLAIMKLLKGEDITVIKIFMESEMLKTYFPKAKHAQVFMYTAMGNSTMRIHTPAHFVRIHFMIKYTRRSDGLNFHTQTIFTFEV